MIELSQLRRIRQSLGLTQAKFAHACGVSQSLVAKIESGTLDPKFSTVKRIDGAVSGMRRTAAPTLKSVVQRHIITATPQDRLPLLIKRMQHAKISQVPVLDGKHVCGLVTERALLALVAHGKPLEHLTVEAVQEEAPPLLPASTPLPVAAQVLEHVSIAVVMERGAILGVVTRTDVLRGTL
jgi:predicted transcriptional regulator